MSTYKAKQFHFIDDMDIAALALATVERVETLAGKVSGTFAKWNHRMQERRALLSMSDQLLDDIGLSRGQVARESAKFFWQS